MTSFAGVLAGGVVAVALCVGAAQAQTTLPDFGAVRTVDATGGDVQVGGATLIVNGEAATLKAAGASVSIHANVAGDADAAAAELIVDGAIGGRARLAAATVSLSGNVAGEAAILGGVVSINSAIAGRLRVGGGQVKIGSAATIGGKLEGGGGTVTLDGHAQGPVYLVGGAVTINGTVDGPLTIEAADVVFGPTAVIAGNVILRSLNEPKTDPGAKITGTISREAPRVWLAGAGPGPWGLHILIAVFLAGSTLISGIILMLLGRGAFEDAVTLARRGMLSSLVIGLVVIVLLPILATILVATIFGIPIGVALFLLLPAVILIGYAVGAVGLADFIFNRPQSPRIAARTFIFLIIGAILIGLVSLIPFVGKLLVLLLLLIGLGAFVRSVRRRVRRSRPLGPIRPPMGGLAPPADSATLPR